MLTFLENVKDLAWLFIILSSFVYYRQLKSMKRERKLTAIETTIYVITMIALPTYATLYLLFLLGT